MKKLDFSDFPWLPPWQPVSPQGRQAYEAELETELTEAHSLFGIPIRAIARTCDGDDVLFELMGQRCRLVVVHMTFSGRRENDPRWPQAQFFQDIDDWVMRSMIPDLARFEKSQSDQAA